MKVGRADRKDRAFIALGTVPGKTASPAGRRALEILVVALAAVAPYAHTVGHGFAFDDTIDIVLNGDIRSLADLPSFFTRQTMAESGVPTGLYRPATTLSFALDYALAGLNPWWFHLVNVLLHAAVSLLVLGVIRGWFGDRRAAFGSALLFAVLPVHVEAVANVAGRKELLAAGFCLATVLGHRRAQAAGGWRLALPPLTFAAALLSKEIGAAALGVVVAEDLLLRREQAFGPARRRTCILYGALASALAGYLVARWLVVGGLAGGVISPLDNPAAQAPASTRLLTAVAVLGLGLRLQVAPLGLSPDYSLAAIPLATSPLDPRVLGALAALAALGAFLWSRRRERGLAVAAVLYLLALLPASNLLFPVGTIFGERLLYLPSVATCALLGHLWARASAFHARVAAAAVAAVAVVAAAATFAYAAVWRDNATLFAAAYRARPASAKVRYNYAVGLRERGDLRGALREYDAAIAIHPGYGQAWCNRGALRIELGDLAGAYADLSRAVELNPRDIYSLRNRALLASRSGEHGRALADLDAALSLEPGFAEALLDRALVHRALRNPAASRADALAALRHSPPDWPNRAMAQRLASLKER